MPPSSHRLARHVTAWVLLAGTLFLILWGGFVKTLGAGLSVPDWPTAYGTFIPVEEGNIFWEHTHRELGALIGLFTLINCVWTLWKEPRRGVRALSLWMLAGVVLQGILGGLTVWHMTPDWLSSFHATLAQIFLCMVAVNVIVTCPRFVPQPAADQSSLKTTRLMMILAVVVILANLITAAFMRHADAGLAIPDFPAAYGLLRDGAWSMPPLEPNDMERYNHYRMMNYSELVRVDWYQIKMNYLHTRVGAALVTLAMLAAIARLLMVHRRERFLFFGGLGLLLLLVVQVSLGIAIVWTERQWLVTSFHVMTGAATFAATAAVAFWTFALRAPAA